jgi:phosphomannomutase
MIPIQVGGSNLVKQQEQLGSPNIDVTTMFDFCFSENGLTAYRLGEKLASNNFIQWLGEDKYQALVDFVLKFIANTKLPRKRGTFVEFRNGMVNISPVGRAASIEERDEFEAYVLILFGLGFSFQKQSWLTDLEYSFDKIHNVRKTLVESLKKEFPDYGLT